MTTKTFKLTFTHPDDGEKMELTRRSGSLGELLTDLENDYWNTEWITNVELVKVHTNSPFDSVWDALREQVYAHVPLEKYPNKKFKIYPEEQCVR